MYVRDLWSRLRGAGSAAANIIQNTQQTQAREIKCPSDCVLSKCNATEI